MPTDINTLRARRAEIQQSVNALVQIERDGGTLSDEQIAEFADLDTEFQRLTAQIERLERAEQMAAATAQPLITNNYGGYTQPRAEQRPPGVALAIIMRSLCSSRGDPRAAAHYADTVCHAPDIAAALNTGTNSAGGFVVPPSYIPELIELLRPASVVRRMGARTMPMPAGTLTMPKLAGGATAEYQAEGDDTQKSQPSFGQLVLSKKKLTALVPISNDLIRFSSPSANELVRDDMIAAIGVREDKAFIRDNGTGNVPKGLRYWAPVGNVIAAAADNTLTSITNDLGRLELALINSHVRMLNPGWLMSGRTYIKLLNQLDGNGNKAFPELAMMQLRGKPVAWTTQIPNNLGVGGTESELYLVDFADAIIGDATGLIIDISTEATYMDGGQLVSAFSKDETVVRAITEHDFGMRHDPSVAVLTGVTWGA